MKNLTKKHPKVVITIVNWNKKDLTKECLKSIKKFTNYKNYNVVVSDNGSSDGSNEMIKKEFKWVDLLENKRNLGCALANNVGINYSIKKYDPDYFFILNNDTKIFQRNWLEKMVEIAESDPKIGIVGCKLIYPDGSLQYFAAGGKTYFLDKGQKINLTKKGGKEMNKIQEVRYYISAAILIKRKVINKIGLFDRFFPYYGEEIDYCERVWKNGFKVIYNPETIIIHLKAQTVEKKSMTKNWYILKKQSIKIELLNYSIKEILYWQLIHFGAIFLSKRRNKIFFNKNFPKRFFLLIRAYLDNLPHIPRYLYKRKHRDEKIWILK